MHAPGRHDSMRKPNRAANRLIVVGADRVAHSAEAPRVGGSKREQICDDQSAKSPIAGESYATSDRRIIVDRIRGRRIQANEANGRLFAVPNASE